MPTSSLLKIIRLIHTNFVFENKIQLYSNLKMSHVETSNYFSHLITSVKTSRNTKNRRIFQEVDMKVIDQAVNENDFDFVKGVLDKLQNKTCAKREHYLKIKG